MINCKDAMLAALRAEYDGEVAAPEAVAALEGKNSILLSCGAAKNLTKRNAFIY